MIVSGIAAGIVPLIPNKAFKWASMATIVLYTVPYTYDPDFGCDDAVQNTFVTKNCNLAAFCFSGEVAN